MAGSNGLLESNPGWDRSEFLSLIAEGTELAPSGYWHPTGNAIADLRREDRGWIRSSGTANTVAVDADRSEVLRQVRWIYRHIAWGANIVRVYTFLTVGEGLSVEFESDADQRRWDEIADANHWERRHKDIVRDTYLLGEWFTYLVEDREAESGWRIRGIEPLEITDIDTDPMDVETVRAYVREIPWSIDLPASVDRQIRLDPEEVVHTRVNTVGNDLRGTPVLFTALRYLRYCEKFLQSRHFLNLMRARLPVIRKVIGTATDLANQKATTRTLPPPGSVVYENQGAEWQFPELNVEGSEAKPDFRHLLLAIAASVSLPEYLVTGDASNANYSSTLVSEAPMVRFFQDFQARFCADFRGMIRRIFPGADVKVSGPPVIRRKIKDIADALNIPYQAGVISRETYQEKLGLNARLETERLNREAAETEHTATALRQSMATQPDAQTPDRAEAS